MSSQGIPGSAGPTGYVYGPRIQDASEWTKLRREQLNYVFYNPTSTQNMNVAVDPYFKYGNQFKLSYDFGKYNCEGCSGAAFEGASVPIGSTF